MALTAQCFQISSTTKSALNECDICRFLSIYRPECVHVMQAEYGGCELAAKLRKFDPGLLRAPSKHLTRVQIVHYVGQCAYVLAGCMAKEGALKPLSESTYIECVSNELCTFRKLELRFRQYLPNAEGVELRISCHGVRRLGTLLLLPMSFELGNGACRGSAEGVIVL